MKTLEEEGKKIKTKTFLNDETYKREESLYSLQVKFCLEQRECFLDLFILCVSLSRSCSVCILAGSGTDHEHFSNEILLCLVLFIFRSSLMILCSLSQCMLFLIGCFFVAWTRLLLKNKPVFHVLTNGQIPVYSYETTTTTASKKKWCYRISVHAATFSCRFQQAMAMAWVMPVVREVCN